jgi:membrane-associated protein
MGIFEGENLINLIKAVGHLGLFAIVFAESGLLFGFFLPGDSLLFTAGFLASQGHLNIFAVDILVWVAAILGDNVGYAFGKKVGPRIFKKEDSLLFHKDNLMRAEKFYEEHGPKTIIFARFMPVIRTF